jgi:integrase/recombinase XerD
MRLSEAISAYIKYKRASGLKFRTPEIIFGSFVRTIGDADLEEVTTESIAWFLDSQPSISFAWRAKYQLLACFFDFWALREALAPLKMPLARPAARETFVPHIYSRCQIRSLLRASSKTHQRYSESLSPQTLRAIILFFYATGASVAEVVGLKQCDVDANRGVATLYNRFGRPRKIPMCRDLKMALQKYERWRGRRKRQSASFFVKNNGEPLAYKSLSLTFAKVCTMAQVRRSDGAFPTMQDFRATFAVHRITAWLRSGADLNRMLPALAAYMGYLRLCATEKYLPLTSELFRKELNKLSPVHRRGRWHEDTRLMAFLGKFNRPVMCHPCSAGGTPTPAPASDMWSGTPSKSERIRRIESLSSRRPGQSGAGSHRAPRLRAARSITTIPL